MDALADNRRVHADEIAVQAIDGAVILRGTVGSPVQQVEAARTARRVLGVRNVEDQLQVRPMGPDERADADTRAAVLAALIDDDDLHAADIDVKADDGTVTLSGLVEFARTRDRAERLALGVAGVAQVHNRLKVLVPVSPDDIPRRPSISAGDRPAGRAV
jgi:osmotically-inducible protein OsmY